MTTPDQDPAAPDDLSGADRPAGVDHRDADPAAVTPAVATDGEAEEGVEERDEVAEAAANEPTGADDVGA